MQLGLHALGIGAGARRDIIDAVARCAEAAGVATLWAGEHVVMVDEPASRYPYSDDGRIAVPADADWLDPLVALSFAAAATSRIRLATGIMLLPEHNPVLVAKQTASIDVLSGGRLSLGVGVGWSAEEFAALGVPFAGRGRRMDEYIDVMRLLWRDDVASFHGEYVSFDSIRVNPRPVRDRRIPIVIGGNGDAALRRAALTGDGWYGFYLSLDETAERAGDAAQAVRGVRSRPRSAAHRRRAARRDARRSGPAGRPRPRRGGARAPVRRTTRPPSKAGLQDRHRGLDPP